MSVAIVSILLFEIGDFGFSDKAKNAFLYVQPFLQLDIRKDTFSFLQCNAL